MSALRRAVIGRWQRHREGVLLGGLMLCLCAAIAAAALPPPPASLPLADRPGTRARLSAGGASVSSDPASADLWMDTALARPLFALDRRPAVTDAIADGSLPRLSGTIRFAHTALAVFAAPTGGDSSHPPGPPPALGVGAQIAGWTIAEVSDERVLLTRGGETRSLQLDFAQSPPPPAVVPKDIAALRLLHGKKSNVFWQP